MKAKKLLNAFCCTAVLSSLLSPAYADDSTSMFGGDVQRTHLNGSVDPLPWMNITVLKSLQYGGKSYSVGGGNGTGVAMGQSLLFPVSATNDDPVQWGFLSNFDLSKWSGGVPFQKWATHIQGVSNSSPVIHGTNAYLAAGDTLYGFSLENGIPLSYQAFNIKSSSPVYQNQVKSHPLYVTATESGTDQDLIWVSSQNGWLFAIDPNTLFQVYAINIGSRMDGSPTLVKDTNGKPYIAVATAYDPNNKGGTGTLYIIDPSTGKVVTYMANPFGQIPVVTAPIATGTGYIAYNDYNGDVIFVRLNADKSISKLNTWQTVGGSGKVVSNEAGFTKGSTGNYVMSFTNDSTVALVDLNNWSAKPLLVPISGNGVSSPTISSGVGSYDGSIYVGDSNGYIDRIDNVAGVTQADAPYIGGRSGQVNGTQNLASVMEADLPYALNTTETVPTLAFVGNDGLHIWQNVGGNYDFAYAGQSESFVLGKKATFSKPLTLNFAEQRSFSVTPTPNDQIDISYSVDGQAKQALTSVPAFDSTTGKIRTSIALDPSVLNQIGPTWFDQSVHKITFTATAHSNNRFTYTFNSKESGKNKPSANVTVPFTPYGVQNPSDYKGNLVLKFKPLKNAVMFNNSPTITLEVTNEGTQDVDTNVKFSFHASDAWPYQTNGYTGGPTPETNFGMDESVSFPVHAPAHKTVTVNVPKLVSNPFYDSCYQQWQVYKEQYQAYLAALSDWSSSDPETRGSRPRPPIQPNVPNVQPAQVTPNGYLWNLNVGQRWVQGSYSGSSYNGAPANWYVPDSKYNISLSAIVNPDHVLQEQTYSDNSDSLLVSPNAPNPPGGHTPIHLG